MSVLTHNPTASVPPRTASGGPGVKMVARDVKVFYGAKQALKGIDLDIQENRVLALIGPSGCHGRRRSSAAWCCR